jgi:3-oxoacyl-[acyl-carrier-protein] synthase-3
MIQPAIKAIEYYLPDGVLSNAQLAAEFPEWSIDKISEKTGIYERRIAAANECSSDLGAAAAKKLFAGGRCRPEDIDYLLLCTQSPDYFLPATACVLQHRLGIGTHAGALDFNLGCSGFVYGLGLAKGLIESRQAESVLLITAETYSKFMHPRDKSVRSLFGDAAAATLIQKVEREGEDSPSWIGPSVWGTDGRGAGNLIVPAGGMRAREASGALVGDDFGNARTSRNLYMNGPEILQFTLSVVPDAVRKLLSRAQLRIEDIDLFVFHQANQYMLDCLRRKLHIPPAKFVLCLRHCGNTVSSTIPIALKHAAAEGVLRPGHRVMLVGFGVGYSWGATLIRWTAADGVPGRFS